jgi:hypothetical protein
MNKVLFFNNKNFFNRRSCLVRPIQKTMAMTNIKFDRHFFIIPITQKLLAGFYLNLYPVVVMKFYISHYFLFFPHPHRQLLSLSHLVRVQRDPALPY